MRIAIPTSNGLLCPHFGHCDEFTILDVNPDNRDIKRIESIPAPEHEPGLLPKWLREMDVSVVIAGGMGARAQSLFSQIGISLCLGAPSATPVEIARAYLEGTLETGENICNH